MDVDQLKHAAEQGDADVQFFLGHSYAKGEWAPQDPAEAVKWFQLAAAQGHAEAQQRLRLLGVGSEAARGLAKAHPEAVAVTTGESGGGCTISSEESVKQRLQSVAGQEGAGVPAVAPPAAPPQTTATEQPPAEMPPATGTDSPVADELMQKAQQGDADAQCRLGIAYTTGDGVLQDSAKAAMWFRKAAAQGHAEAQSNLGIMHAQGRGAPQDPAEAIKWFQLAAGQGHLEAQFNLGMMYDRGQGTPQNNKEAYVWYSMAIAGGLNHEACARNLARVAEALSPDEQYAAQQEASRRRGATADPHAPQAGAMHEPTASELAHEAGAGDHAAAAAAAAALNPDEQSAVQQEAGMRNAATAAPHTHQAGATHEPTAGQTTVVVQQPPSQGVGIASFVCGLVSIFFLAIVFVPLALLLGIIGLAKGQHVWSILGLIFAVIGFFLSPTLRLMFFGMSLL